MSRRRLYPERPIVGVGIFIQEKDRYLLIKRAAEPDAGLWSIPGGLVEVGEKTSEAAIREALEETCLNVEIQERIDVIDKIVYDDEGKVKYHFIIIDYLAKPIGGVMCARDDALDARWVTKEQFKDYHITPTLIDLLQKMKLYPD